MNGTIISIESAKAEGGAWSGMRTVIYEVGGKRYCGAVDYRECYYFGGGAPNQPNLSDIDEAFKIGYPEEQA